VPPRSPPTGETSGSGIQAMSQWGRARVANRAGVPPERTLPLHASTDRSAARMTLGRSSDSWTRACKEALLLQIASQRRLCIALRCLDASAFDPFRFHIPLRGSAGFPPASLTPGRYSGHQVRDAAYSVDAAQTTLDIVIWGTGWAEQRCRCQRHRSEVLWSAAACCCCSSSRIRQGRSPEQRQQAAALHRSGSVEFQTGLPMFRGGVRVAQAAK
jgi:hypothetical protein